MNETSKQISTVFSKQSLTAQALDVLAKHDVFSAPLTEDEIKTIEPYSKQHLAPLTPLDEKELDKFIAALLVLPKPKDGIQAGQIKQRIYNRMLIEFSKEAMAYATARCLDELNWFPTPKQIRDRAKEFKHPDQLQLERIKNLIRKHKRDEKLAVERKKKELARLPLSSAEIALMPPEIVKMGLSSGYLKEVNGEIIENEE